MFIRWYSDTLSMPITNPKGELIDQFLRIYQAIFTESEGDGTKRSNFKKGNRERGGDGLI